MTEEYIIQLITELMPPENKVPRAVLYENLKRRVQKDLSNKLSKLFNDGKIEYHRTLNSITIQLK